MGSTVPHITNLRALPTPSDSIWPQAVFDLDYAGGARTPVAGLNTIVVHLSDWGRRSRLLCPDGCNTSKTSHLLLHPKRATTTTPLHAPDNCWCSCLKTFETRADSCRPPGRPAGNITLTIEARVDVTHGAAWSSFDKAIRNLEGGQSTEDGPQQAAPAGEGQQPLVRSVSPEGEPPGVPGDSDEESVPGSLGAGSAGAGGWTAEHVRCIFMCQAARDHWARHAPLGGMS